MRWFELIFLSAVGILFLCFGWTIWKKERISLIHAYHYQRVKDRDKKGYTEQMGKALLLIGAGIILTGLTDFMTKTLYGWWIFGVSFCTGLIRIIYAQIKYNHGLF